MTTITHEQAQELYECGGTLMAFYDKLAEIGITIAPPSPPEGMVKLADDAVRAVSLADLPDSPVAAWKAGYLAALQFADKVVTEPPPWTLDDGRVLVDRDTIRRKLGAIE